MKELDARIQYNNIHVADLHKTITPKYILNQLPDDNGGINIQYTPPCECPKGESLLLEIKADIKVKKKWKGRICFTTYSLRSLSKYCKSASRNCSQR